ncbi:hypothetical protein FPOAC2_08321 [Fusarium poae]|jgi:hypothetical protein
MFVFHRKLHGMSLPVAYLIQQTRLLTNSRTKVYSSGRKDFLNHDPFRQEPTSIHYLVSSLCHSPVNYDIDSTTNVSAFPEAAFHWGTSVLEIEPYSQSISMFQ